jgi:beta-galactosidase
MYAFVALLIGAQAVLAWTFNSHIGGEEQALFGLLDHDGTPSWKVDEFARIASEFKQLSKLGFPRYTRPEVAIAYSFDSFIASHPNGPSSTTRQYFKSDYTQQVQEAFEPLFRANMDVAIINVGNHSLSRYKLVIVPADYVMDAAGAKALRDYVSGGGSVLMTAWSAKVNEHAQWFETPLPGRLNDVFGLKTNEFYEVDSPLTFELDGASIATGVRSYEVLEPSTATVLARFTNTPGHSPAITINKFGKGNALYLATESKTSAIRPVLNSIYRLVGLETGPRTPDGVYARVVDGRTLYVNTTQREQRIPIDGRRKGIISGREYDGIVILGPQDADLIP